MTGTTTIGHVTARRVWDSRGRPTVEADVILEDGLIGRGCAPSGASTGSYEAIEVRDGIAGHFRGKGVQAAVAAVNGEIADALVGRNATDQNRLDRLLIELDGVPREKRKAKFCTVVTYIDKNEELWTEGRIDGIISESIIGDGGFGYDPIFFVPHIGKTFAELSSAEKNKISHRGIALQKLRKILINVLK